jgi:hypothetical protein
MLARIRTRPDRRGPAEDEFAPRLKYVLEREARTRKSTRRVVALALAVISALVAGYWILPALGSPSPDAINTSLSYVTGGSANSLDHCERQKDRALRCSVMDGEGSGSAQYMVTMNGRRCWIATKRGTGEAAMPGGARGCVMLHDQLRLVTRLIGESPG